MSEATRVCACGHRNSEGVNFCAECGRDLRVESEAEEEQRNRLSRALGLPAAACALAGLLVVAWGGGVASDIALWAGLCLLVVGFAGSAATTILCAEGWVSIATLGLLLAAFGCAVLVFGCLGLLFGFPIALLLIVACQGVGRLVHGSAIARLPKGIRKTPRVGP